MPRGAARNLLFGRIIAATNKRRAEKCRARDQARGWSRAFGGVLLSRKDEGRLLTGFRRRRRRRDGEVADRRDGYRHDKDIDSTAIVVASFTASDEAAAARTGLQPRSVTRCRHVSAEALLDMQNDFLEGIVHGGTPRFLVVKRSRRNPDRGP